jgi:hypothetical protein
MSMREYIVETSCARRGCSRVLDWRVSHWQLAGRRALGNKKYIIMASLKFEIYFRRLHYGLGTLSFTFMKRRSGTPTQKTSQHILADHSMTSLELKGHESLLNKRPRLRTLSTAISTVPLKVRQGRLVF